MFVIICSIAVLFSFKVSAIEVLKQRSGNFEHVAGAAWVPSPDSPEQVGVGSEMNSTTYMSVNHYYCAAEEFTDPVLILYGTKSWTFPIQDVNLTLSYPTANSHLEFVSEDDGYIITGFKVVLYIDGMETRGYIVDGGVLQESLVLTFVSAHITSLSYEFWLYGTPKLEAGSGLYNDLHTRYFICT